MMRAKKAKTILGIMEFAEEVLGVATRTGKRYTKEAERRAKELHKKAKKGEIPKHGSSGIIEREKALAMKDALSPEAKAIEELAKKGLKLMRRGK